MLITVRIGIKSKPTSNTSKRVKLIRRMVPHRRVDLFRVLEGRSLIRDKGCPSVQVGHLCVWDVRGGKSLFMCSMVPTLSDLMPFHHTFPNGRHKRSN